MYAQLNSVSNEFIGKNANFYQSPIQISNLCINNSPSNTPKRKKNANERINKQFCNNLTTTFDNIGEIDESNQKNVGFSLKYK